MWKKTFVVYILIFFLSLSYLLIFQNYGINLWDEGVLLNGSLRTLEGESVYVDFNGYPPGRYLLGAVLFKIFGINISAIRIAVAVMTAIAATMVYSVSLRLIPSYFLSIIPSILFLISPAVYYNRFYPIFTIFGIYMIFWYLEKENPFRSILLGVSAVLSMFFKLEIGIGIIIISIALMLIPPLHPPLYKGGNGGVRAFKYFFITLSIASIFLAFYYLRMIDMYAFLYDSYFYVFKIRGSWGNPFPNIFSPELWRRFDIYEIFSVLLFYIPLIIYLLIFIILIRNPLTHPHPNPLPEGEGERGGGRGEGEGELRTFLATILFFGIYTYNLVIWRAGFDNLIRCLPPAFILGGYLLYLFRIKLLKWTGERMLSYAIILILPLWFLYEMIFHSDFYAGSIGELRKNHVRLSIERANNIYADPVEALWIKEITGYIRNNTKTEDTIFAIPFNPIWYFLTDRKNPTYYEWLLPGELKTEKEQTEVVEQLKKKIPAYVIYADIAIDNKEERRFSNYAPLVYNFIIYNYHIEKRIGFFQIWRYGNDSKQ